MLYWLFRRKFTRRLSILFIICFIIYTIIDSYFSVHVAKYTKQKASLYGTVLIEDAIRENVLSNLNMEQLIIINRHNTGLISSVQLNTSQANSILADVLRNLYTFLSDIERNRDFSNLSIPLGLIFSDTLFANAGPRINITLRHVGTVKADIESSITEYGINNSLVEVNLVTEVNFAVLIPFRHEEVTVKTRIPLLVEVINGEVPKYYYSGGSQIVPRIPSDDDLDDPDDLDNFD